jgi:hypothetical protein
MIAAAMAIDANPANAAMARVGGAPVLAEAATKCTPFFESVAGAAAFAAGTEDGTASG